MTTIALATRNRHKAQEIGDILGRDIRVLTLNEFPGAPVVVEDAPTFEGNAKKKAASLAAWLCEQEWAALPSSVAEATALYALADDSGLEVEWLDGAPGVHSARFAAVDLGGGNSSDAANNAKLLRLLEGIPPARRTARFRCVLGVARLRVSTLSRRVGPFSEGQVFFCAGACEGRIALAATGQGGFGYDPLFIPNGHDESFASLGEDVKNTMSHRAKALRQFVTRLAG